MTLHRSALIAAVALSLPLCARNQDPAAALQFEVAYLKPTVDTSLPGRIVHLPGETGYRGVNMPLMSYLTVAYQVRADQITLPESAPGGNFDMEGKAGRTCTADELHLMLQHLLEERFHLQLHRTAKQGNGYTLVVEKGGSKMTDHDPEDKTMLPLSPGWGQHKGTNVSMQYLAFYLSQALGETVVDKTGLTGHYDFELDWQGEAGMAPPPPPDGAGSGSGPGGPVMLVASSPGVGIFEALRRQLGLRLEKGKISTQQIVIDHIEKLSDN